MNNIENKNKIYLVDLNGERLTVENKKEDKEEEYLRGDENIEEIIDAIKSLNILFKLNTWKEFFEWSKDNMSTVLIGISGIGAIIQIKELASIHVSYIRFFSVTQLISDGALVLLTATFIGVTAFITSRFLTPKLVARQIKIDVNKGKSFSVFEKYVRYLAGLMGSIICVVAFAEIRATQIQENTYFYILLIAFMYAYLTYSGLYYSVFDEYLQKTNDEFMLLKKYSFKGCYKALNTFMIVATAMVIVIIIFKSMFMFPAALRLPYNLENYNNIKNKIEKDNSDIEYYNLRYFNDTYAFIEIKKYKESKSNILIYKTEDLIF